MWVLDYLDDIDSDLSRFHQVTDMWAIPARKFFRYAERLHVYDGAMRARLRIEQAEREEPEAVQYAPGTQVIDSSAAAIAASPLGDVISVAQV